MENLELTAYLEIQATSHDLQLPVTILNIMKDGLSAFHEAAGVLPERPMQPSRTYLLGLINAASYNELPLSAHRYTSLFPTDSRFKQVGPVMAFGSRCTAWLQWEERAGNPRTYTICLKTQRAYDSDCWKKQQLGSSSFTSLGDDGEEPLFALSVEHKILTMRSLLFLVSLSDGGFEVLQEVAKVARPMWVLPWTA